MRSRSTSGLADIDGFVLLDLLKHDPLTGHLPVHVISGVDDIGRRWRWVRRASPASLPAMPSSPRSSPRSPNRSAAASACRPGAELPAGGRAVPELAGTKMLIVDDDIRNIYSLTSVLESYDVEVLHAERGRDGIRSWSRPRASTSRSSTS
jgi:CheY-like chemotaxis protein